MFVNIRVPINPENTRFSMYVPRLTTRESPNRYREGTPAIFPRRLLEEHEQNERRQCNECGGNFRCVRVQDSPRLLIYGRSAGRKEMCESEKLGWKYGAWRM